MDHLSSILLISLPLLVSTHASLNECTNCNSTTDIPHTTTPMSSHPQHSTIEDQAVVRVWHHNHSLTLPFILMCVMAVVFLCFVQATLILIKRRLTVLKEVTVTISASQLHELVEKKCQRDQNVFSIAMSPTRGPPSYTSIDLNDDDNEEKSYASLG